MALYRPRIGASFGVSLVCGHLRLSCPGSHYRPICAGGDDRHHLIQARLANVDVSVAADFMSRSCMGLVARRRFAPMG